MGDKGDKNAARPPEGSLVETRYLIKGPKSAIVPFPGPRSGPKSRTGPGAVFILRPTSVRICHKAVFKVGPVAWPKPNAIGSSKNTSKPVGIPFFGAPQAPGDKPNPSEECYSLGGRPPEARGDVSSGGTHPNRLCSSHPQPVESAPPQDTKHRQKTNVEKGLLISRKCCDTQLSRVNMEFPHKK